MRDIPSLALTAILAAAPALAQGQAPASSRIGFYLGLDYNVSSVRSTAGYIAGAEIAAIFSRQFSVGLVGYGLANDDATVPAPDGGFQKLGLGYGGIRVGYLLSPDKRFHPAFDLFIGTGQVRARRSTPRREDEVVVIEPTVGMEANAAKYLHASLGLGYRMVAGSDLAGVSNESLSALSLRLTLRFGRF